MPYISKVAARKIDFLPVFGNDYSTPDVTGVRDYVHVMDLVKGHNVCLRYLMDKTGILTCNLGTGRGYGHVIPD